VTEEVCMYIYVFVYMYIHIHMYIYINVYIYIYISGAEKYGVTEEVCTICAMLSIGNQVPLSCPYYRVAKTRRMPYVAGRFLQKSP